MSQMDGEQCITPCESEGWTRRFTAVGPRLEEAIALYSGLGFEIRLEPAEPAAEEVADRTACAQCFVMALALTIYTRPPVAHATYSGGAAAER